MELYALREMSADSDLHEVDLYYLEAILHKGKGPTRTLKASSLDQEDPVAVKLFPKQIEDDYNSCFLKEEAIVTKLSHPYLIKYYNFYKDALIKGKDDNLNHFSAIVMEYIPSGDLFKLISMQPFSEKLARTIFKQMIAVTEYLHTQNIAHLDIKLENFLINHDGIKLIDFDKAQNFEVKQVLESPLGTPGYRPPEFVRGNCKDFKAADIYSLGIVLFMMVTGTPPYSETLENINFKFDAYYEALRNDVDKFWKAHEYYRFADHREPLSHDFKQLFEGILAEKPQDRLNIEEIKRTQWFKGDTFSKEELKSCLSSCLDKL